MVPGLSPWLLAFLSTHSLDVMQSLGFKCILCANNSQKVSPKHFSSELNPWIQLLTWPFYWTSVRYSVYISNNIVEIYKATKCHSLAEPRHGRRDRIYTPYPDRLPEWLAKIIERTCVPLHSFVIDFFSSSLLQHVIYSVKFFISYAIPDVSKSTKSKIKREKYLTQKLLHENHLKDITKNMGAIAEKIVEAVDNNLRPKLE